MKFNLLSMTLALGTVFTLFTSSMRDPNNPPTGKTGAPGETTCGQSSCHSGGAYAGTVTISGVPDTAIFGHVYPITVKNTSNAIKAGFQLTCLDAANVKCGTLASASGVSIGTGNSRQYARQSSPKTLSGGSTSWTFNWTAPTSASGNKATFYFVSLCANGNGQKTGDNVILNTKPIALSLTSPTQEPAISSEVKLYPTAASEVLHVELLNGLTGRLLVFNTEGRMMLEKDLGGTTDVDVTALAAGAYIATIQTDAGQVVRKFVKN